MDENALLAEIDRAPTLRQFVEEALLSRVPWIFAGDAQHFAEWRRDIAVAANVDGAGVFLVGSAATGFSLSPLKPGRAFRRLDRNVADASDIDIAVVDPYLFEKAWNSLLSTDRSCGLGAILRPTAPVRSDLRTEMTSMRQNVYWGTISAAHAGPGTAVARALRALFAATTRRRPFSGYTPRARIYRRRLDLVAYHEQSLRSLRDALRERSAAR